jgi:hypothetical protein
MQQLGSRWTGFRENFIGIFITVFKENVIKVWKKQALYMKT